MLTIKAGRSPSEVVLAAPHSNIRSFRDFCSHVLNAVIGKYVLVRLKNSRTLRGKLIGFDEHLNLVLEEAHFIKEARKLGSIILRGDNIVFIILPTEKEIA